MQFGSHIDLVARSTIPSFLPYTLAYDLGGVAVVLAAHFLPTRWAIRFAGCFRDKKKVNRRTESDALFPFLRSHLQRRSNAISVQYPVSLIVVHDSPLSCHHSVAHLQTTSFVRFRHLVRSLLCDTHIAHSVSSAQYKVSHYITPCSIWHNSYQEAVDCVLVVICFMFHVLFFSRLNSPLWSVEFRRL